MNAESTAGRAVTAREHTANAQLPDSAWTPAADGDGDPPDSATVVELTCMFAARGAARLPRRHARQRPPRTTPPRRPAGPHR